MMIKVEQRHLAHGYAHDCFACPIALAINEVLKPHYGISVNAEFIGIWAGRDTRKNPYGTEFLWKTECPELAKKFIGLFDFERGAKPFEFELDIPAEFLC
jgi:hypothetical protein